jgi:hypothetical protein
MRCIKTLFNFVRWLNQNVPEKMELPGAAIHEWFAKYDDDGWFGHNSRSSKEKKRAMLQQLAEYFYEVRRNIAVSQCVRFLEK